MSDIIEPERISSAPPIAPVDVPSLSDDECLVRLARAVEAKDARRLQEVAQLIARLAVTVE